MIKVIAFDLDDTLYPEREYVLSGFRTVSKLIEGQFNIKNLYPDLVETFNRGEKNKTFDITLKRLGIEHNEALVRNMVNCYRAHFPDIKPYEDVVPTLQYLRKRFYLALITDGYLQAQKNKVKALNIEQLFETIIYTGEYGGDYWKPNPLSYKSVMKYFSVEASECACVGDNMEKDFIAPNRMGWLTVQIKREEGQYTNNINDGNYRPQIRIDTLKDLKMIL